MPTDWFESDVNELVSERILKDFAENKEILIFFCLAPLSAVDEAATVK